MESSHCQLGPNITGTRLQCQSLVRKPFSPRPREREREQVLEGFMKQSRIMERVMGCQLQKHLQTLLQVQSRSRRGPKCPSHVPPGEQPEGASASASSERLCCLFPFAFSLKGEGHHLEAWVKQVSLGGFKKTVLNHQLQFREGTGLPWPLRQHTGAQGSRSCFTIPDLLSQASFSG